MRFARDSPVRAQFQQQLITERGFTCKSRLTSCVV
jgi:hypothetical protein